jgi:hypothetical protein
MKTLNINYEQNLFDDDINTTNSDDKFVYRAPSQYEPNKRTYYSRSAYFIRPITERIIFNGSVISKPSVRRYYMVVD